MKDFIIKLSLLIATLACVHIYYMLRIHPHTSGDLGQMARIPFTHEYDTRTHAFDFCGDIAYKILDIDSASVYKLLFMGDSFSEPEIGLGHSVSEVIGDTVRFVCTLTKDMVYEPIKTFHYGLTHGYLHSGQTVVVEIVERSIMTRLGKFEINDTLTIDKFLPVCEYRDEQKKRIDYQLKRHSDKSTSKFSLNDMLTWIRSSIGYKQSVYHEDLKNKMFDHSEYGSTVFFYKEDLLSCNIAPEWLAYIAAQVDSLFVLAEEKGVNLYLLLVPDKYEIYYPYIKQPTYPCPNVLDFLNYTDKKYLGHIINIKDVITLSTQSNETDVYRLNDSHWSTHTAREIGHKIGAILMTDSVLAPYYSNKAR